MQTGGPSTSGSSIWSIDVSPSGERVAFSSGYPDMAIVCLHGKGKKEFEYPTGGIPGTIHITKARGDIIAGMVARRGLGNIICVSSRGKLSWQITTHKKIENLDVTGEGDVVCGTKDGTLLCLDKGGVVAWHKNLGLYKGPLSVAFFKDNILAFTNKGNAYMFDRLGNQVAQQSIGTFINKVSVSQEGHIAASVGTSKTLYLLDPDAKVLFCKELEDSISALALSSKGNFVLVGTTQGSIHLLSRTGRTLFSHLLASRVNCLAISENERYFAAGTNDFYVYFFNTKGDLYWVYKTGAQEASAFSKDWPQGAMDLGAKGVPENMPAPRDRQEALTLEAFGKLTRKPELDIEYDKKGGKGKARTKGVGQEGMAQKDQAQPERSGAVAPARRGVVIKHWVDLKDIASPMYYVKVENHLDYALEALEVIPKMTTATFKVLPDYKDFESVAPKKNLLLRFRLSPVDDFKAFEDTQISSDVNYVDPEKKRMVAVKPSNILIPFNIPQIQLAPPEERTGVDLCGIPRVQIDKVVPLSGKEISKRISGFIEKHKIPCSKNKMDGRETFTIFGKDYRGNMLMVELAVVEEQTGGRITADIRSSGDKLLPPLYYLVLNQLDEILTTKRPDVEEVPGSEEWLDEESDVEWVDDPHGEVVGLRDIVEDTHGHTSSGEDEEGAGVTVLSVGGQTMGSTGPSKLDPRAFYLMDYQDRRRMLKMVNASLPSLKKCLMFSRVYPLKFREMYEYDPDAFELRWISGIKQPDSIGPEETKLMVDEAAKFLKRNPKGLIVLDGLDYLLVNIDFSTAYNLVSDLRDLTSMNNGSLLVCLHLGALSDMELEQLKKEADGIILA